MGGKVLELESERLTAKGIQQGMQQGIQQGIQQGLEQGRAKAIKETARKLKSMGLALTDIQLATGLSEEDILDL